MTHPIRALPFRHNAKPLAIEVFPLADLYARARRGRLGHALEAPQRPEFHTIYVGVRGRGRLVVDFTAVPLGAGYLTFVARGRVQQFDPACTAEAWMILVEPQVIPAPRPSVLSPAWPEPALAVPPREHRELIALAQQLAFEQARPLDPQQAPLLAALVQMIVLRAERLQTWHASSSDVLERFFTILERDCTRTRSVAHYARATGISPRRLGELLVEHTGKSTKQVIDERVVLEHKRLLVHTDLAVKELAERSGFPEPTNLVKFFRLHTGLTPLEFRAAQRTFLPSVRRS